MDFTGKSPAQVAKELAWGTTAYEDEILAAIQHFSNRNLIAARRYEFVKTVLMRSLPLGPELVKEAELSHPNPE